MESIWAAVPTTFSPVGPKSDFTAFAWWVLFGVAAFVCVVVIALAVGAVVVRRRAEVRGGEAKGVVLTFGVVIPALVLAATFGLSVVGIAQQAQPSRAAEMTVEVVGHEWWWEVRYPGTDAVTANEVHVPVGTPVRLRLTSADVIHSFWVPAVMPKLDLLPGHTNETWLQVDRPGTFRGQCAEYCGVQHAHMAFSVVAENPTAFRSWLDRQAETASVPSQAVERQGYDLLTTGTCSTCHTVRGTSADGEVGPDLTHLAGRQSLGADTIPNDKGHLAGWIANSQLIKPGNKMPPQPLTPSDLAAVVAYLQTLE